MATRTGVINEALRLLGEPPSTGPSDNSRWVQRLNNAYDATLSNWLEDHPWNFATTLQQLTQLSDTPLDWLYAYNKPATCLRILRVTDIVDHEDGIDYVDRAGQILTDTDTAYLFFVDSTFMTQEGGWPQKFADALSAMLALRVHPVTSETSRTYQRLMDEKRMRCRDAKTLDAVSNPPQRLHPGRFAQARTGGIRSRHRGRRGY